MQKIKRDDKVKIIAGKDRGKEGVVLRVTDDTVVVEGINIIKKHTKANPQQDKPGGIISKEAPLHISNVAIINPNTNKIDKVGFKKLDNGDKVRILKSSGEVLDV